MNDMPDPTPTTDTQKSLIESALLDAYRILVERLDGNFQIIWTGYDEDLQITRTFSKGYGNTHARASAVETWLRQTREALDESHELDIDFIPWDDETGEPE